MVGMSGATDDQSAPITFTDDAIAQTRATMEAQSHDPAETGVRFVAREKNCNCGSLAYGFRFEPAPEDADTVADLDGLEVYLDPESEQRAAGAVVDYVSEPGRSGFTVENPNVDGGCGCGGHH